MKKIIFYLLAILASVSLYALPQDDAVFQLEGGDSGETSLVPSIKFIEVNVTAECISEEEIKYCFDMPLCEMWTAVDNFHVYISPVPGNDWQYVGNATQVGSDDFHYELCFISNEVLDPGTWVIHGNYGLVNPDDIFDGNGSTWCSNRKLFDIPEPTGDCGGCEVELVVTDSGVDITSTLTTEMLCGDNCVDIEVSNMEWADYTASAVLLTDGQGLFCSPGEITSFQVFVEGEDVCGNHVNLTIDVIVEQNCDEGCEGVDADPHFSWEADCLEVKFADDSQVSGGIFIGETLWDFGYSDGNGPVTGTTQGGGDISHTFPAGGEYTVCITIQVFTANGECCHYEYCETIEVSEGCGCIPEPTIEVNPGLCPVPCCYIGTFTNNASYAPSTVYWIWGDGTQTIIHNDPYDPNFNSFNAFHTYSTSGQFDVQVLALYHPDGDQGVCCAVFSNIDTVWCNNGGGDGRKSFNSEDSDQKIKASVSPNPVSMSSNQVFYLDIENVSSSDINMQLMDMNGRVVYEQLELSGESKNMIQIDSQLAAGMYLIKLFEGKDNVQNLKLLVTE